MVNGSSNDTLSEESLANGLNLFPTLAFNWNSPVSYVGSPDFPCRARDGSLFDSEDAAILFRRIDLESKGQIAAADLQVWRRKLPFGRSEDDLVQSVLATACADKLNPPAFFKVLQDDPMLAAELCTQAAVLDFIAGDDRQKEGVRPSESMIKAFVCVAKLKLRRLASAYRDVYSQEDTVSASVFRALNDTGTGSVGANDMHGYLQKHANVKGLSENDVRYLLDAEGGGPAEGGVAAGQSSLNKEAFRKVLSRPAHRNLAMLLYRFAQVQQERAGATQVAFAPVFDDATKHLPRTFDTEELQSWFEELDEDRDGCVTSQDLIAWCTSASWQGLMDEGDLESLFHPSLPNFNVSPAKAAQSSLLSAGTSQVDIELGHNVSPILAAHSASMQASRRLDESTFSAALARRPLLAARLVLVHRYSRIVKAKQLVEASANAALSASENVAAAAVESPEEKRVQVLADAAISAAQHAVAITTSVSFNMVKNHKKSDRSSVMKDDAVAQELRARMKEAETNNTLSASTQEARRALKEHFLVVAERNLTLLSIEVALEVKLLAWREAEHCPAQLQELRALIPLHSNVDHGQGGGPAPVATKVSDKDFESSGNIGLKDARIATL
jgi:Ca2+-binding EF-hand superfamily protein